MRVRLRDALRGADRHKLRLAALQLAGVGHQRLIQQLVHGQLRGRRGPRRRRHCTRGVAGPRDAAPVGLRGGTQQSAQPSNDGGTLQVQESHAARQMKCSAAW